MKRFLVFLVCLFGLKAHAAEQLTIAVIGAPHSEILEMARPILADSGVELTVRVFSDFGRLNGLVREKQLDGNFFQHRLFLEDFNREHGANLVEVTATHIELMGLYSQKVNSLKELPDGAAVAIPNDPSNRKRALQLLSSAGLVELANLSTQPTVRRNLYGLKIHEMDGTLIPRLLPKMDLAVITTNYAIASGVNIGAPLLKEKKADGYVNILVTHPDHANRPAIRKLASALQSDRVQNFIHEKYRGLVIPAFDREDLDPAGKR